MKLPDTLRPGKSAVVLVLAAFLFAGWLAGFAFGQLTLEGGGAPWEELAIIVNKANPVENLSLDELRKYFRLEHDHWPNGRKTTVVMLPPGSAERDLVLRAIYHFTESEFSQYFIQETFTGHVRSAPKELISAVNVRKFVFNVPGAIGYIRARDVDDSVKVIRVDGRGAGEPNYPFRITIPPAQ